MTPFTIIQDLLNKSSNEDRDLTTTETLDLLKNLKCISEEKLLIKKLLATLIYTKEQNNKHATLTKREYQVLKLIGCNFKSSEISITLSISNNTVATHRKNIIKKLGIKGTRQLKVIANEYVKNTQECI